jgi:hypothetical protein
MGMGLGRQGRRMHLCLPTPAINRVAIDAEKNSDVSLPLSLLKKLQRA